MEEVGGTGAKLRQFTRNNLRRQAEEGWEAVAAALQAKGGNRALAQSLLLKLNSAALGHLAARLTSGPFHFRDQRVIGEVYQRWGEVDFSAALTQAQSLDSEKRWSCVAEAIRGFALDHPAQVCEDLASPVTDADQYELRIPDHRDSLLGEMLTNWGEQDPAAAGAFQLQHPALAKVYGAVEAVATGWTPQDPQAAVDWATRLPATERENALRLVFTSWAQTDLPASIAYLSNLSAGSDRDGVLWGVGTAWGKQNPPEAARWAETQGGEAANAVLNAWSQQDPIKAALWGTQQASVQFDPTIWDAAATNYVLADPDGALGWINGLPEGSGRDIAIAAYGRSVGAGDDFPTALGLVQTMSKPLSRETNTVNLLNAWLSVQPPAAKQWINQAHLPATVTSKLNGG